MSSAFGSFVASYNKAECEINSTSSAQSTELTEGGRPTYLVDDSDEFS